jgi:hypothetical protein
MSGAFERLSRSVLLHLGQDAFLVQGTTSTATRVNVERGVELTGEYGDAVVVRDVATIDAKLNPKVGDVIQHPMGNYVLDGVMRNSGYTIRFTVIAQAPAPAPAPAPGP